MPTTDAIRQQLATVKYPGFSRDIISFGLVKDIVIAGGEVTVSAQWLNGRLSLSVADTGVGIDAAKSSPSTGQGFGMAQLHERLSTRFGDDITIECIANKPEGTCVKMVFSVTK